MSALEDEWPAADVFYGPMRWSEKVERLSTLQNAQRSEESETLQLSPLRCEDAGPGE